MKTQFNIYKMVLCALATVAIASLATTVFAKNPKEVNLEIVDDQLVITTKPKENDCPFYESRENGCIKVKKGEKSEINFHLKGDTKCTRDYGTDWELSAVYLGGYNSADKPGTFGFDAADQADFNQVNTDFNGVDKTSGRVTTIDESAKKITINNKNQYRYHVWYQIEATCERTDGQAPHIATSDPRIKNGGTE